MSTNKRIIQRQRETKKGNISRLQSQKPIGNEKSPTMITKEKPTNKVENDDRNSEGSKNTNIIIKAAAKDNNLKSTDKCLVSGNETQEQSGQENIFDDENSSSDHFKRSNSHYAKRKSYIETN